MVPGKEKTKKKIYIYIQLTRVYGRKKLEVGGESILRDKRSRRDGKENYGRESDNWERAGVGNEDTEKRNGRT